MGGSADLVFAANRFRARARSQRFCSRIRNAVWDQPTASSVREISGEIPQRPFRTRDSVFRESPSLRAASPPGISSMHPSRMLSPGCGGLRLNQESLRTSLPPFTASLPVVINQVTVEIV